MNLAHFKNLKPGDRFDLSDGSRMTVAKSGHIIEDHQCGLWYEDEAGEMQVVGEPHSDPKDAEITRLRAALEKLAKLGNGDRYGNSDGNMIARAALEAKP